jgi:hypothetical protein
MNKTKKNAITCAMEFAICLITIAAFFLAILSFVGMVEEMSISYTSSTILVASLAWIALVVLYMRIINK